MTKAESSSDALPPEGLSAAEPLPADAPSAGTAAAGLRLLLVDDDAVNRIVTAALLLDCTGCEPDTAVDGEEALEMAQATAYDLILMDLVLPGLHGTEAARRIRALPGPHGRMPIVALSASAFADEVARSLGAGMNEHQTKPLTRATLQLLLQRWVRPPQQRPAG